MKTVRSTLKGTAQKHSYYRLDYEVLEAERKISLPNGVSLLIVVRSHMRSELMG
jgi:hypothetical protein